MEEFKINENLIYMEFESDILCFNKLEELLNSGFTLEDSPYVSIKLKKDNLTIILSYTKLDRSMINEHILSNLKDLENTSVYKPNFNNSLLNVVEGIKNNYQSIDPKYDIDYKLFDKKYDNYIILILDGLGTNILEGNMKENSFLRSHFYKNISAIYPSTTAAATTSIKSGKTPLETGWTGWQNYFKELNRNIVLFNGMNYYTREKGDKTAFDLNPYDPFFKDLNVKASIVEPDFKKNKSFKHTLKKSLKGLKNGDSIQYVYDGQPDTSLHHLGDFNKSIRKLLKKYDRYIKWYSKKLPKNTLLMISADHGHKDVKPIALYSCNLITSLLERPISNDARCATFKVKENEKELFKDRFNKLFGSIYDLYDSKDARLLIGNKEDIESNRTSDNLADFVAVAKSEFYFEFFESPFKFKSHHAGYTKDEMEIPLIVYRKE